MIRILFITPTFARTGSEMVLWNLIKNLDPAKYKIFLFSVKKGELLEALPNHVSKAVSYKSSGKWHKKAFRSILKLIGIKDFIGYQLKQIHQKFKADLWFINTIIVPEAYLAATSLNVKIATYFHEIDNAFGFIQGYELQRIINLSYCCIGCSELVVKKVGELGHKNVKLQNSFINNELIITNEKDIALIKKKLGIIPTDFIWVISGTGSYMKGLDMVLPVLNHFKDSNVKIIWIGEVMNTGLDFYVKTVANRDHPGNLIFTGPLSDEYYNYLSLANGLLMLSREECFPLVMLEAAYLGIPIVAYSSGSIQNFIENGMGKVVEGLDIKQLCKEMQWIQSNFDSIDKNKLRAKAIEFTVQNQVPHFEKLLEEIFNDMARTLSTD